jgi:hypothetical protein
MMRCNAPLLTGPVIPVVDQCCLWCRWLSFQPHSAHWNGVPCFIGITYVTYLSIYPRSDEGESVCPTACLIPYYQLQQFYITSFLLLAWGKQSLPPTPPPLPGSQLLIPPHQRDMARWRHVDNMAIQWVVLTLPGSWVPDIYLWCSLILSCSGGSLPLPPEHLQLPLHAF